MSNFECAQCRPVRSNSLFSEVLRVLCAQDYSNSALAKSSTGMDYQQARCDAHEFVW